MDSMKKEINKKGHTYVESDTPQDKQEYKGWFWNYPEKKFYRWDNLPYKTK